MKKFIASLIFISLMMAGCQVAPPSEVVQRGAGPYPDHYAQLLQNYLECHLYNPKSLKNIVFTKSPEKVVLDTDYPFIPLFEGQTAWEAFVVFDAKKPDGRYADRKLHVVWFRHNRLVAYDYQEIELECALQQRYGDQTAGDNLKTEG